MQIQVFNSAYLVYEKGENGCAFVIDPGNEWKQIKTFLKTNQLTLKYILVSCPTFKNALRIAEIRLETGAKFFSFQSDLLELRKLPRLADEVNVCGIKVPHIDRFLDGLTEIDICGKSLKIKDLGGARQYQVGDRFMPEVEGSKTPSKVVSPGEME